MSMLSKLLSWLLLPISCLVENIYRFRRFCYNFGIFGKKTYEVPIVSVGNLTFGGTGKTPYIIWLSDFLATMDKKVLVLMRGYKGKLENSSGILRSTKRLGGNPEDFGDEAILLSRKLKNASIAIGKNRSKNLEKYFSSEKPDVILLDDGHQHLKIQRDLNIVLFDALMPLEKYKVAPLGYLREGMSALKDADLVILGRSDLASPGQLSSLKEMISCHLREAVPFAELKYRPNGFYNVESTLVLPADEIRGEKVVCVVGTASPASFFRMMEVLGAEVVYRKTFPDHHAYTVEEISQLLEIAKSHQAWLVVTEKDVVKIKKITDSLDILYLDISVEMTKGEEEAKEIIYKAIIN